jgi:hypothetical protein
MIETHEIQEILAQYKKHGWNLSRVLLSAPTKQNLSDSPENLFGDVEIISSDTDAAWFSRASGKYRETWELRRLGGTPFALVEVFEAEDDEEIREETRQEMQTRLGK